MVDTLWAAHDGGELMNVVAEVEALKPSSTPWSSVWCVSWRPPEQ